MNLSELWISITNRRVFLMRHYGSEEAALHYIANDRMLNDWYLQADRRTKSMIPLPSPAFKQFENAPV